MSKTGLEKIKTEADQITTAAVIADYAQTNKEDVLVALGALGGMSLVSRFIGVSKIKMLQNMRDEEKYVDFGCTNFKDFLETHPLMKRFVGISYKTFNNLENQMKAEGEEIYELLNQCQIPLSTRQVLITNGSIEISAEGDKILYGEEEISLDSPNLKQALRDIAKEKTQLIERGEQADRIIKNLQEQVKTGTAEYEQLRRASDAQASGTPYEQALTKAVGALVNLTLAAKEATLLEKTTRGRNDMETLWKQLQVVRTALYLHDFVFEVDSNGKGEVSDLVRDVIEETGDFEDDDEG